MRHLHHIIFMVSFACNVFCVESCKRAISSGVVLPGQNFTTLQVEDEFFDEKTEESSLENVSESGRLIGGIFLSALSVISFVFFLVAILFLIFRWGKFGGCGKVGLLGCSIILFLVFVGSAIAAGFIFYYLYKGKISPKATANKGKSEYVIVSEGKVQQSAETIGDEVTEMPMRDEVDIAKFARERFNNAMNLYEEYQKSLDPEVYKKALLEIEAAIQADDSKAEYYFLAGKMYSEVAPDYTVQIVAEEYLRKSLELDPKNLQALLTLANCLALQERYYEAGELFTKALSRDYYGLRDYLVPIITFNYIYDYQAGKGEKFLRKLLENDPDSEIIRICLAIVMNKQGTARAEDAKNELRKVINKPDAPPILKTYASNLLKNFDKWHDRRYSDEE